MTSFSNASPIRFNRPERHMAAAYDPEVKFNRRLTRESKDPKQAIFSIDTLGMLKVLEKDDLAQIYKLTLVAQTFNHNPTQAVAFWDAAFNLLTHNTVASCIFASQGSYKPLTREKQIKGSRFPNMKMAVNRLRLNELAPGDRLNIAITQKRNETTWVLLYVIDSITQVLSPLKDKLGESFSVPAVNIRMEHAIKLDSDFTGQVLEMETDNPYNPEAAGELVQWMTDCVYDITRAYPWRPHFVSFQPRSIDRKTAEPRIKDDSAQAIPVSYLEFEDLCRKTYDNARVVFEETQSVKPEETNGKRKRISDHDILPKIEVVRYTDRYVVKFDNFCSTPGLVVTVELDEFDRNAPTEVSFKNQDANRQGSHPQIMQLSVDNFPPQTYLRYFTMHF